MDAPSAGAGGARLSYWPADRSTALIDLPLGELLRQVAAEVPDRTALVDGVPDPTLRRRWTYRQLLSEAERVARILLAHFHPGDRIAVLAPNSAEWVLLQHGASLAGLVLVPVNPAYGEDEVAAIVDCAEVCGLFHVDAYRGRDIAAMVLSIAARSPGLRKTIGLGDWAGFMAGDESGLPLPQVASGDTVLIQFTSGTTGRPKGARLHHRGVINTSRFVGQRAGFPDGGVWANAMPMFHIAGSVVTQIAALSARGAYVLAPGFDAALLMELIESERANATLIVPTMILAMLEHEDFARRDLTSLKTILTGAAAVPAALAERAKSAFKCDLSILFGQTEVNGVVCQTCLDDSAEDQCETLGRPLPQVEVCIADPQTGEMAPLGAPGEICVRGYQVMQGYFGRDADEQETLRSDGWLRTGDLAVMDARGYLKIVGRLKDMIIRGGMNIYPREIEDVLFDHPDVAEASVVGVADARWGEVVAAVVRPERPGVDPTALHEFCRTRLAPHKTPAVWFFVDTFPLTPSGKVQKFVVEAWIRDQVITPVDWTRPVTKVAEPLT